MDEEDAVEADEPVALQKKTSTSEKAAANTVNTAISAATAGAAIGSMILPGVGTIFGSILGTVFGSVVGALVGGVAKEKPADSRAAAIRDLANEINSLPDEEKKALVKRLMSGQAVQIDEVDKV
jgi:outer membrane lipoprotein SlyB